LIHDIEKTQLKSADELHIPYEESMTFDPNARYQNGFSSQQMVDDVMSKKISPATQEEIDKLFHKE